MSQQAQNDLIYAWHVGATIKQTLCGFEDMLLML